MQNPRPLSQRLAACGSLTKHVLGPQLLILFLYLFDRFDIWALAWTQAKVGANGLGDFFFRAVTGGVGWPMLSAAVLTYSLLRYELERRTVLVAAIDDIFVDTTASEVAAVARQWQSRSATIGWVLGAVALCAVGICLGSLAGAYYQQGAQMTLYFVPLGAAAVCGYSISEHWDFANFSFEDLMGQRSWSHLKLEVFERALQDGRLSGYEHLIQRELAVLAKHHAELAAKAADGR